MKKIIFMYIVLATCLWQVSVAQSPVSASSATNADTAVTNFITKATMANMKEIETGKLAQTKAADASVKSYGSQMVNDHTTASNELMALVKSKGITMPQAEKPNISPSLASASGTDFDRRYVITMIMDHKRAVALFENASKNLTDPDFKAFAAKTLPILKQHLATIQAIAGKMNINLVD